MISYGFDSVLNRRAQMWQPRPTSLDEQRTHAATSSGVKEWGKGARDKGVVGTNSLEAANDTEASMRHGPGEPKAGSRGVRRVHGVRRWTWGEGMGHGHQILKLAVEPPKWVIGLRRTNLTREVISYQ